MRPPGQRLWRWSLGYAIFLVALWPIEFWIAERWWLTASITYWPQWIYLVPIIPTLLVAAWRRHRLAVTACALSTAFVLFFLMDLRLQSPLPVRSDVNVLVWNIAHAIRGREGLAEQIGRFKPDVLIFQESSITDDPDLVHPTLRKALAGYQLVGGKHLLIASKFPVIQRRTVPLQPERDKYMLEATIDVHGTPIRIYNLHLQPLHAGIAWSKDPFSLPIHLSRVMEDRLLQVTKAREAIERWDGAAILGGDLNGPSKGLVYQRLSDGFIDAHRAAGTGFGFTIPSEFPMTRKDYLFGRYLEPKACIVGGSQASDHCPLHVFLDLGQPPNLMGKDDPSD